MVVFCPSHRFEILVSRLSPPHLSSRGRGGVFLVCSGSPVVFSPKRGEEFRPPRLGAGTDGFHGSVKAKCFPDPGDNALKPGLKGPSCQKLGGRVDDHNLEGFERGYPVSPGPVRGGAGGQEGRPIRSFFFFFLIVFIISKVQEHACSLSYGVNKTYKSPPPRHPIMGKTPQPHLTPNPSEPHPSFAKV